MDRAVVLFAEMDHLDHVRVIGLARDPRLAQETLAREPRLGLDDLDRDGPRRAHVARGIDHAHPAATDDALEPVSAGDQRAEALLRGRQRHCAAATVTGFPSLASRR